MATSSVNPRKTNRKFVFLGSHCLGWLWHPRLGPRVTLRLTLRSSSSLSGSLFGSLWLALAQSGSIWLTRSPRGSLSLMLWLSLAPHRLTLWLSLARSGSRWLSLAHSGSLWLTLAHPGSLWLPLAPSGSLLTHSLPHSFTHSKKSDWGLALGSFTKHANDM